MNPLQTFLEGGSAISELESEEFDPSVWVLELVPKKERISMSSWRYLIDSPNLAIYKKNCSV